MAGMLFGNATGISTGNCSSTGTLPRRSGSVQLRDEFDELFSTVTGYDELDRRIARTRADRTYLPMVVDDPEIPLHNNPAEPDAKQRAETMDLRSSWAPT
jgi:hypothetical protein